jgi:hypothetical protein
VPNDPFSETKRSRFWRWRQAVEPRKLGPVDQTATAWEKTLKGRLDMTSMAIPGT